jgi:hypothetical protein
MTAHLYWRIYIDSCVYGSYPSLVGLQLSATIGGSNIIPVVSANGNQGGHYAAAALDGSTSTYWGGTQTLPGWWEVDFGAATTIAEVKIANPGYVSPSYAPDTWDLQYSDDNSTWTTKQSYTSAAWTAGSQQTFSVTSPSSHRYWRIYIHTNGAGQYPAIAEIAMASTSGGPNLFPIVSASATTSGTPLKIFDTTASTFWQGPSSLPASFEVAFNTATDVNQITMTARTDYPTSAPGVWDLQYSDDNTVWTTKASFTSAAWTAGSSQTFTISGGGGSGTSELPAISTRQRYALMVASEEDRDLNTPSLLMQSRRRQVGMPPAPSLTSLISGRLFSEVVTVNPAPRLTASSVFMEAVVTNSNPTVQSMRTLIEAVSANPSPPMTASRLHMEVLFKHTQSPSRATVFVIT